MTKNNYKIQKKTSRENIIKIHENSISRSKRFTYHISPASEIRRIRRQRSEMNRSTAAYVRIVEHENVGINKAIAFLRAYKVK